MPFVAYATEYFPLTRTLSLREREQQASDGCLANSSWASSDTGVIERRWTILPLPALPLPSPLTPLPSDRRGEPGGEGRGEGESSLAHSTVRLVIRDDLHDFQSVVGVKLAF